MIFVGWAKLRVVALVVAGASFALACDNKAASNEELSTDRESFADGALAHPAGGDNTVSDISRDAFGQVSPQVRGKRADAFFGGNSLFRVNWVIAPASAQGRDGLGPFYNAPSCSACHIRDGRGAPPTKPTDPFVGLLVRISVIDPTNQKVSADPVYGQQIQPYGILDLAGEATPRVHYEEIVGTYSDGSSYSLRSPTYSLEKPTYGALDVNLRVSPRVAPPVFGVGLLESIPVERLMELADPNDDNGDGISGRPNRVPDVALQKTVVGRFGWKANQPTVEQQAAGAFGGDMGITTTLFPNEHFSSRQASAGKHPNGGTPELEQEKLDLVVFYLKTLAVPARRNPLDSKVVRGEQLFGQACTGCHTPMHVTGPDEAFPELAHQTIYPYTDLLLHDMGPGLSDDRPDHDASGREWRTPPLWGIGLVERVNGHTTFLHDGRARNLAEAILWHDGEAAKAQAFFRNLSADDRAALLAFLEDL